MSVSFSIIQERAVHICACDFFSVVCFEFTAVDPPPLPFGHECGREKTNNIPHPPRMKVTEEEQHALLAGCKSTFAGVPKINGVAVMGSSPQGVAKETLVKVGTGMLH